MATIAVLRVPAAGTLFGPTFEQLPTLECELEQVVEADALGHWVGGVTRSALEPALDADSTVADYDYLMTENGRVLYLVEWSADIYKQYEIVVEEGGAILSAVGKNGTWTVRLRFPDWEAMNRIYERFTDQGITVDVARVHELSTETADEFGLTETQYKTLTAAIDHGYFEIPREISMKELADELEISHQALSERFRRAYRGLVLAELDTVPERDNDPLENEGD